MNGPDDPALDAPRAVRDLILAGERFRHVMSDHVGVGSSETVVMSYLGRAADGLTPREIGDRAMMTSGTLSAVLDRLEAAGMVERAPNPGDRRSVLIRLLPPGEAALAYAGREWVAAVARPFDGRTPKPIVDAVRAIAASLDSATDRLLDSPRPDLAPG